LASHDRGLKGVPGSLELLGEQVLPALSRSSIDAGSPS
jgi:hypothetical protein